MSPELIKLHIASISSLSDEELVHNLKCSFSSSSKLLKPYIKAIEKERKLRGKRELPTEEPTNDDTTNPPN